MNELKAASWAAKRKMGRSKYVLKYWMIGFGIAAAAFFTLVELILLHQLVAPFYIVIRLSVFTVVGFFIGSYLWDSRENKYAAFLDKTKNP